MQNTGFRILKTESNIRRILVLRSADLKSTVKALELLRTEFPGSEIYALAQKTVAGFISENAKFAKVIEFPYRDFNMAVPESEVSTVPEMDIAFSLYKNNGNGYDEVDAFLATRIKAHSYGNINGSFEITYGRLSAAQKRKISARGTSLLYGDSKKASLRSSSFNKRFSGKNSYVVFSGDSEIILDNGGKFVISPETICRFGYVAPDWKGIRDEGKAVARIQEGAVFEIKGSCNFFNGVKINLFPGAKFAIGDGSYIAFNSRIFSEEHIEIGRNCAISWDVEIIDTDFHRVAMADEGIRRSGIVIGDHAWIGAGVRIMKGVRLGKNVLVAANSVVTKSFPDNSIIGGNPAAIIGQKKENYRV